MLYVDIPAADDLKALAAHRGDPCVSLYLPTTPLTQQTDASRLELKNLGKRALDALTGAGADRQRVAALAEQIDDLVDDDAFWRFQAHSLAVLATPDNLRTFRLPNALSATVAVSDRFHLKPLLRAVTFPHSAWVLALAENAVRLVEVSGDLPAATVAVAGLPADAASAVGKASINDRSPSGRLQGAEGQKVRLRQYARQVTAALRGLLSGSETPLILAAAEPLASIFRSVNTYPHLVAATIAGNADKLTDAQLAERARAVLDGLHRDEIVAWQALFATRGNQGRATADPGAAARAATFGAVDSLLVDIDSVVPGTVDEQDGTITPAAADSPDTYGVVDEIARRVLLSGGRVLGVRSADIPGGAPLAAILRYPV